MSYTIENITKEIKGSWARVIMHEYENNPIFSKGLDKINKSKNNIYPYPENVLETFKYFELNETKVVLLGQDPYIRAECHNNNNIPQAMGLSFSVPNTHKIPPSLANMYKELHTDTSFEIPNHGDISRWVKEEKILLLNAALTVIEGKSNSHKSIWSNITDNIIKYISDNTEGVVFLLLGNFAKNKANLIDTNKHKIIEATHPSPLSAKQGFFGSKIFSKVNKSLFELGKNPIDWKIN